MDSDSKKCETCEKNFKYKWMLDRHKKNKNTCSKSDINFECELCHTSYANKYRINRHYKTKKHMANIVINGNANGNIFNSPNSTINNYNNIINLTLNVKSFKDTDIDIIQEHTVNRLGKLYLDIISNNTNLNDKILKLFENAIYILEFLHFNLEMLKKSKI